MKKSLGASAVFKLIYLDVALSVTWHSFIGEAFNWIVTY